jgi:hypothetical protein
MEFVDGITLREFLARLWHEGTRPDAERERLHREIAVVFERRALARRQSLLPIRQPKFLILLAVNLAMLLVLPVTIQWLGAPFTLRPLAHATVEQCGLHRVRQGVGERALTWRSREEIVSTRRRVRSRLHCVPPVGSVLIESAKTYMGKSHER